ncbi:hypothetical protein MKX03_021238, partial [Papaver bracteatum]
MQDVIMVPLYKVVPGKAWSEEVRIAATYTNSENLVNNEISLRQDLLTTRPSSKPSSECDEGLDSKDIFERGNVGETNLSDSLDIFQTLKKDISSAELFQGEDVLKYSDFRVIFLPPASPGTSLDRHIEDTWTQ